MKKPVEIDSESEDEDDDALDPVIGGAHTSEASSAVNPNGNSNMPGAAHASCIVANCRAYRAMKPDYNCQLCDGAMHIVANRVKMAFYIVLIATIVVGAICTPGLTN